MADEKGRVTVRIGNHLLLLPIPHQMGPMTALGYSASLFQKAAQGEQGEALRRDLKVTLPRFGTHPLIHKFIQDVVPDIVRYAQGEDLPATTCALVGKRLLEAASLIWEFETSRFPPERMLGQFLAKFNAAKSPTSVYGEIRPITSVFGDISGFSALTAKLAAAKRPDLVFLITNELHENLAKAITSQGGSEVNFWGDAIRGFFGAPKARVDDPVRAVRAAVDMQAFMEGWNRKYWETANDPEKSRKLPKPLRDWLKQRSVEGKTSLLDLRIGISSGEEVAWGLAGETDNKRYDAFGHGVNVAARMEPLARPGGIVITQETLRKLHNRFDVEPMLPREVKNIEGLVYPYIVIREKESPQALLPFDTEQMPFRGREQEMSLLRKSFEEVVGRRKSKKIIIGAPPGLGKSRIGAEFADELELQKVPLFIAKGDEVQGQLPYSAISSAIRHGIKIKPADSPENIRQKIQSALLSDLSKDLKPEILEMHVQLIAYLLLGAWLDPEHPTEEMIYLEKNQKELWERIVDSTVFLFRNLTKETSVALIVDDMQWVDSGSLEFIDKLSNELADEPLFTLGLSRPEFLASRAGILKGAVIEHLKGLELSVVDSFLDEALDHSVNQSVKDFIRSQSNQNPFLLRQWVRAVKEGWKIEWDAIVGQWKLIDRNGNTVPTETESFLQAMIDHLPDSQKYLLRLVSIIGSEFLLEDVRGLLKEINDPTALFPADVWKDLTKNTEEVLDRLVAAGFLTFNNGKYQFPHSLMKETAYKKSFEGVREGVHSAHARHLEKEKSKEYAVIAYHYERGGEDEKAAHYYYEAAEEAAKRSNLETAAKFYRKGFDLSNNFAQKFRILRGWYTIAYNVTDTAAQDEVHHLSAKIKDQVPPVDQAGFHYRRGRSWIRQTDKREEGYRELLTALKIVAGLLEGHSDGSEKDETVDAMKIKGNVLVDFGVYYGRKREFQQAEASYKTAIQVAQPMEDHLILGRAFQGISFVESKLGNYSEALRASYDAYSHFEKDEKEMRQTVTALSGIGTQLALIGAYPEAEEILRKGSFLSQRFGGKGRGADSLAGNLGRVLQLQGKNEEAIQILERHWRENPDHPYVTYTLTYLALAYLNNKQPDMAVNCILKVLPISRKRGDLEARAVGILILAQALLQRGDKRALRYAQIGYQIFKGLGSVEEFDREFPLILACIFKDLGDPVKAFSYASEAKAILEKRAAGINGKSHRASFLNRVEVNRRIMETWLDLKTQIIRMKASSELDNRLSFVWKNLKFDRVPTDETSNDVGDVNHGRVVWADRGKNSIAKATLNRDPEAVFRFLISNSIVVKTNPSDFGDVSAENIWLVPFMAANGKIYVYLNWRLQMEASWEIQERVLTSFDHWVYFEELLEGDVSSSTDGTIGIALRRSNENSIKLSNEFALDLDPHLRIEPHQFGELNWQIVPVANGQTALSFIVEKELFTSKTTSRNVLQEYMELATNL